MNTAHHATDDAHSTRAVIVVFAMFVHDVRENVRDSHGENATNENTPTQNLTNEWTLQAFALSHNYIIIGVAVSTIFHRFDLSYHHHSRRPVVHVHARFLVFVDNERTHAVYAADLFIFRASGKSVCVPGQNINMENRWLTLTRLFNTRINKEKVSVWLRSRGMGLREIFICVFIIDF